MQRLPGALLTAAWQREAHSAFAVATFSSNLKDPHHMSGAGSGNGSATASSGNLTRSSLFASVSMFDVYFFLDAPHRFDFRGLFEGTSSLEEFPNLSQSRWEAAVVEFADSSQGFIHGGLFPVGTKRIQEMGTLRPGNYRIVVGQHLYAEVARPGSSATSQGEFSFDFDLTPVPEPASILLLGSGLMGLLGLRRRRN